MPVAEEAYNDFASLGRIRATIGLITGFIISILLIIFGAILINKYRKNVYTLAVNANTSNINCGTGATNGANLCSATATYIINGKTYTLNVSVNTPVPNVIQIYYNPSNPADATNSNPSSEYWGGIFLLVFAGIIMLGSIFTYWLTRRYKAAAAAEGVGTAYDIGYYATE